MELACSFHNCVLHVPKLKYNVLHVTKLKYNLLSVQQLCHDNNCEVGFDSSSVHVKDKAMGKVFLKGISDGGIYTLSSHKPIPALLVVHASAYLAPSSWSLWI